MKWVYKRYFKRINQYKWTFYFQQKGNKNPLTLARHIKVGILRHIKVKKDYSVYDDNFAYWTLRLKKIPNISDSKLKLLKKQKVNVLFVFMSSNMGILWKLITLYQEQKKVKER